MLYLGSQGPEGPAYELASRFAENLGVPRGCTRSGPGKTP